MHSKHEPKQRLVCPQCKSEFFRHAYYVRRKLARNNGKMYCSPSCFHNARWGGSQKVETKCSHCEKPLTLSRWQVINNTRGVYCSPKCMGLWNSLHLSGENSPGWKGGKVHSYGRCQWKHVRAKVRERDGHVCQCCSKKWITGQRHFDVHHIEDFDLFDSPAEANKMSNLVTLCRKCHCKFHPRYTGVRPKLAKLTRNGEVWN